MKTAMIVIMGILFSVGTAFACSVVNKVRVESWSGEGFEGECSNNGNMITCLLQDGSWVKCSGPSGAYTGVKLRPLIYSACGCVNTRYQRDLMRE